ncbi:MAG TPA: 16S rRNA (uracil(1498)-N(3))-methyltransferase [Ktedonobacteraceae bacterium]|nr:16S rRNA (uracil(1498)-N(3))-methyltransferase [Ktedonobacteraceae bacterium]
MHRFFVAPELLKGKETLTLPEKLAHQVRDVLHLVVGEPLALLDNSGDEVLAEVVKSGRASVEVRLLERYTGKPESPVRVLLCQGLLKSARFEWILEKGTELGVSTFAPILCRRSMAGLEDAGPSKIRRWQRIIQEAAEQCGRSRLPILTPVRPLMHALNDIPRGALALIPWEEEHGTSLREALTSFSVGRRLQAGVDRPPAQPLTVVLFIGPEGGLMAEEVKLAQRHGVQPVSLGPRILRAETAALTAVANVMYQLEQPSQQD